MHHTDDQHRAVIYARQSLTRADQIDDSLSIASQVAACKAWVERQGWTLAGIYDDPDEKGWRVSRPAFDRMLGHIRDGMADTVVLFKLSRFMRSLIDQERFVGEIAAAGGELASVMEPYISTSPMVRQILGAVNEQYRRDQADYLRAAFMERARRGYPHGYAPYGYRLVDGKLEPDEPAASVVRQMFAWAAEGHGSPEITHRLNAAGHRTRNGMPWSQSSTLRTLRRPAYTGAIAFHGDVVCEDAHEALVPPSTFAIVQGALDRRRGVRRKESPSWMDGFVEHACGARMYCATWSTRTDAPRWRFRCGKTVASKRHDAERCTITPASIFADKAESIMRELLTGSLDTVLSPDVVARNIDAGHAAQSSDRERQRQRLARRVETITGQRDRLLDLTLRGSVDEDAYRTRDASLRADLARVRNELAAVPDPVHADTLRDRHAAIHEARDALAIALDHAPDELPGILHALDVRLVIGDGTPRLRFGPAVAMFLENGS